MNTEKYVYNPDDFGSEEYDKKWLSTRQAKWMIFKGKVSHIIHRKKFLSEEESEKIFLEHQQKRGF